MILTGREVTAMEGKQVGLVDRLVPTGVAREEAEALAREIASCPQVCVQRPPFGVGEKEAMRTEFRRGTDSIANGDMAGGDREVPQRRAQMISHLVVTTLGRRTVR